MQWILLILIAILSSCTTTPMPMPAPCEVKIKGECREMTAGERNGAVTRGHGEDVKDIKP